MPDELSKAKQVGKGRRAKREGYDGPENDLQRQMDDMLEQMGVEYRRVPDGLWRWLKANCPSYIIKQLSDLWKSKPDTCMLIPIPGTKYSIACEVEIKNRKGNMSPRQAQYAERMPVTVSRSTAENEAAVLGALAFADKIAKQIDTEEVGTISTRF